MLCIVPTSTYGWGGKPPGQKSRLGAQARRHVLTLSRNTFLYIASSLPVPLASSFSFVLTLAALKYMMACRSYALGLGAAAACLSTASAFISNHAHVPRAATNSRSTFTVENAPAFISPKLTAIQAQNELLSEDQSLHTAERLSGMSRGEIQHIFEDIDADGSGTIDLAELDLLAKYFPGETFTPEIRKKLIKEIDKDGKLVSM